MNEWENNGAVIVSWSRNDHVDRNTLLVGKRMNGQTEIINAFTGEEAENIFKKLTEKRP